MPKHYQGESEARLKIKKNMPKPQLTAIQLRIKKQKKELADHDALTRREIMEAERPTIRPMDARFIWNFAGTRNKMRKEMLEKHKGEVLDLKFKKKKEEKKKEEKKK